MTSVSPFLASGDMDWPDDPMDNIATQCDCCKAVAPLSTYRLVDFVDFTNSRTICGTCHALIEPDLSDYIEEAATSMAYESRYESQKMNEFLSSSFGGF